MMHPAMDAIMRLTAEPDSLKAANQQVDALLAQ